MAVDRHTTTFAIVDPFDNLNNVGCMQEWVDALLEMADDEAGDLVSAERSSLEADRSAHRIMILVKTVRFLHRAATTEFHAAENFLYGAGVQRQMAARREAN